LPNDERAIGRAEISDNPLPALQTDVRMSPGYCAHRQQEIGRSLATDDERSRRERECGRQREEAFGVEQY
jgi:hypothetical protein